MPDAMDPISAKASSGAGRMKLSNFFFDLDGTLVDSVPGIQWSMEAALRAAGIGTPCPDLRPHIGPPIRSILASVTGGAGAMLDQLEAEFRESYDGEGWRRTALMPGAADIVAQLCRAGRDLWVVTNKPGLVSRLILRELGLLGFFREVLSRDSQTPAFANKGQILTNLLQRRCLDKAHSIMVGDTSEDCRAAAEAGIACVLVPHGYGGGLNDPLPDCCRRIAGWSELLA